LEFVKVSRFVEIISSINRQNPVDSRFVNVSRLINHKVFVGF